MELGKNEKIIEEAVFDKAAIIRYYWVGLLWLCVPIVTIPLALILAIIYKLVLDKVIDNWSCSLTTRSLHVKKGVLNKIEKTVPLEKITDLQMSQGWIMRRFDLRTIAVETAGQSGPGSLISLMGIKDTERFRRDVLDQRDRMGGETASAPTASDDGRTDPVLIEIRDSLKETTQLLERLVKQGRG
jgi:putative membrane protein